MKWRLARGGGSVPWWSAVLGGVVLAGLLAANVSAQTGPVPAPVQIPERPTAPVPVPAAPAPGAAITPAETSLVGPTWRWLRTEYGDDTVVTVADPNRYTVQFRPDGTLGIRADCNSVTGTYTVQDASLMVRLGASTLVGCPPDSQADTFTRDLGNVATYVMAGGNLVLNLRADVGNMYFEPQPALSLTQTAWRAQSYNNGRGGVTTLLQGTDMTASFGADGGIAGSAGCNTFRGNYSVSGDTLSIGPLATTRMLCAEPIMTQEAAYLAALQASTRFELTAERLTLRSASGATQVVFVPSS
jgi:heat shock protein HslJ